LLWYQEYAKQDWIKIAKFERRQGRKVSFLQQLPEENTGLEWLQEAYTFLSSQRNMNSFIIYDTIRNYAKDNGLDIKILSKFNEQNK